MNDSEEFEKIKSSIRYIDLKKIRQFSCYTYETLKNKS